MDSQSYAEFLASRYPYHIDEVKKLMDVVLIYTGEHNLQFQKLTEEAISCALNRNISLHEAAADLHKDWIYFEFENGSSISGRANPNNPAKGLTPYGYYDKFSTHLKNEDLESWRAGQLPNYPGPFTLAGHFMEIDPSDGVYRTPEELKEALHEYTENPHEFMKAEHEDASKWWFQDFVRRLMK